MKTAERDMARKLRGEEGLAITDIARRLGVSKSSVSLWVRDIALTPEQHDALHGQNRARYRQAAGNAVWSAQRRQQRASWQIEGHIAASQGDPVHAAGCMLFWAEGSRLRNGVEFTNSDPEMIRHFVAFLRRYFDVPNEKLRVACNLFADHVERQREVEQFWLDLVGVPRECLNKTMVNRYSRYSQKKRQNKLPYGTCRVTVNSTQIEQHLYGAIQEYGRFERPEWLD
ncbi:MAG: helix-turn-helix transcriptional regulator [Dehalococcoidia bacterium]